MATMNVLRSIVINKKPVDIFPLINNFDHWPTWSPWLILEKGVKVNVADDKKYYEWEGELTGSGNMQITSEEENKSIKSDLQFLKPWKSFAKVNFMLEPEGEGTKVSWTMESKLPFFMFWMKKMMEAFIAMDYDRGLNMLKDLAENGKIESTLDFKGNSSFDGCNYIGIKVSCSIEEMKQNMGSNYEKLMHFMADKKDLMAGAPFSIYHKWDMVKQQCIYTACVPVTKTPDNLPNGVITGSVPKTKTYAVHHLGSYRHIGNAWSAIYMRQRGKKFKMNKSIDPMEIYLSSPQDTAEKDLQTEIHFAVK